MKLIERIALWFKRRFSNEPHKAFRRDQFEPMHPWQKPHDSFEGRPVYRGPYRCWCNPERKELEPVHHRGYRSVRA